MFNFFKKKDLLHDWIIDVSPEFKRIDNGDSIQYVNEAQKRIFYFSVLLVSGGMITNDILPDAPNMTQDEHGWNLRGTKRVPGKVLICVISFADGNDETWARDFFANNINARRR